MSGRIVLACLLVAGFAISRPALAQNGDYAYLLVQGRISDPAARHPLAGATVRLSSPAGTFHAITDHNGVFVFQKLPVSSYDVQIIDAGGKVVRSAREIDPGDPSRSRVKLKMGRREPAALRLDTRDSRVVLVAPEPPPSWNRFATQMAIFVGLVALYAL